MKKYRVEIWTVLQFEAEDENDALERASEEVRYSKPDFFEYEVKEDTEEVNEQ